jgi:sugar phosphate isomerase/epimerase
MSVRRREFLWHGAIAAGASFVPRWIAAAEKSAPAIKFPSEPRERIAVAAYPFREFIQGWRGWDGATASTVPQSQQVELKDFAAHVAEKFGIRRIELWSRVFPSMEPKYLEELRGAIEKARGAVVNIAVDGEFSQYSPDREERERAVTFSRQWVDAAVALGSPSIRSHIQSAKNAGPDAGVAAENLKRTAEYAAKRNVVVHLENDDAVSEDPFFIARVIDKVKSPWLRALPDFGNTLGAHDTAYAYRGIDAMFTHAYGICHVKDQIVDESRKAVSVDMPRTFAILKHHAFQGYCSMEYDLRGDPYAGTEELIRETTAGLA